MEYCFIDISERYMITKLLPAYLWLIFLQSLKQLNYAGILLRSYYKEAPVIGLDATQIANVTCFFPWWLIIETTTVS